MAAPPESFGPLEAFYNFTRYSPVITEEARLTFFEGETLRLGKPAPTFRLPSIDGDVVDLNDLRKDANVAVVFGSASAPPLVNELRGYEQLHHDASSFGARIVFVYTREIHPNEPLPPNGTVYPHHQTFDQKIEQAHAFRDEHSLSIAICVDDLAGTVHRSYSLLPHLMTVVHRDGTLVHRSEKACAELLGLVLRNIHSSEPNIHIVQSHDPERPDERHFAARPTPTYSETLWIRDSD